MQPYQNIVLPTIGLSAGGPAIHAAVRYTTVGPHGGVAVEPAAT